MQTVLIYLIITSFINLNRCFIFRLFCLMNTDWTDLIVIKYLLPAVSVTQQHKFYLIYALQAVQSN